MVVRKPVHRFLGELGVEYDEGSDYKGRETLAGVQGRWRRDGGDGIEADQRSNDEGIWLRLWTTADFGKGEPKNPNLQRKEDRR